MTEQFDVPPKEAKDLAHLSDGRIGWAISAWKDPQIMARREDQVSFLYDGIAGSSVDRFKISETITKDPENLMDLLGTWLSWWRDLSLILSGAVDYEMITNIGHLDEIIEMMPDTIDDPEYYIRHDEIWQTVREMADWSLSRIASLAYPQEPDFSLN